jgi:hypothetical protein
VVKNAFPMVDRFLRCAKWQTRPSGNAAVWRRCKNFKNRTKRLKSFMEQGSHSAIGKKKYHLLASPSRSCRQDELGGQKRTPNGRPISEVRKVTNAIFRQCSGLATL